VAMNLLVNGLCLFCSFFGLFADFQKYKVFFDF
jgi:hypothetical protein